MRATCPALLIFLDSIILKMDETATFAWIIRKLGVITGIYST